MTRGERTAGLREVDVYRTIRVFQFANDLLAEGPDVLASGGAYTLKRQALDWAGGNAGLTRAWGTGQGIRYRHGVVPPRGASTHDGDHAVPVKVLADMIDATALEPAAVEHVLRTYLRVYSITKAEHALLNAPPSKGGLGLRSSMPDDWDGIDPLARYRKLPGFSVECYEPGGCDCTSPG